MGFMDKAKKLAEQAQAKLDEAQKQFNSSQSGSRQSGGPAVEYDAAGRPVQRDVPATPAAPAPAAPPSETAAPAAASAPTPPSETATPPHGDPLAGQPPRDEDAPPKLSGGDPLAG
jgi:formin 2/WAS/WASL-interacting protein